MAAGLAQAASLAWPWGGAPLWWLQLLSLALLAWLVRPTPTAAMAWRRGALTGFLFATAWLAGTFWWLFISMHHYGGLAAPLAVAAVLGLAMFLASYYAVVVGLFCALAPVHKALTAIKTIDSSAPRSRPRGNAAAGPAPVASVVPPSGGKRRQPLRGSHLTGRNASSGAATSPCT